MSEVWYFISKKDEPNPYDSKVIVTLSCDDQKVIIKEFPCHGGETTAIAEAYDWINRNYPEALPTTSRLPSIIPELAIKIQRMKRDAFYLGVLTVLPLFAGLCISPWALIPGVAIAAVGMYFRSQLLSITYGHSMGVYTGTHFIRKIWSSIWGDMTNQEIDHYQATNLPQLFLDRCKWLHAKSVKLSNTFYGRNFTKIESEIIELERLKTVLLGVEEIRKAERFMNPAALARTDR